MTLRFVTVVAVAFLFGLAGCSSGPGRVVDHPSQRPEVAQDTARGDEPADGAALSNTLRWSTASEVDNFGFEVFRGDSEDGPFELITAQPIAGAGTVDVTTNYAYVDETIAPGREYFYYVESISMNGERTRFTPTMRAAAKN